MMYMENMQTLSVSIMKKRKYHIPLQRSTTMRQVMMRKVFHKTVISVFGFQAYLYYWSRCFQMLRIGCMDLYLME